MPLEVQLTPPIPFEQCLLRTPDQRQELLFHAPPQPPLLKKKSIILIEKIHLPIIQKFIRHPRDPRRHQLDIHSHPELPADDRRSKRPTVTDRKMKSPPRQKWLTRIRDPDLLHRKIGVQERQQITARQMLPSLEWMRHIPLQRHVRKEKSFRLLDMPNPYFCVVVDIMLIKQRHL